LNVAALRSLFPNNQKFSTLLTYIKSLFLKL